MDPFEPKEPQTTSWWIASLAISVLLCTGFAGYVFNIKEDLDNAKIRSSIMEQRIDMLSSAVDNLRRHVIVQQLQVVPSTDKPALPPTAVAPIPKGQPVETAAPPQPVPAPATTPPQPPKH